MDDVIKILMDKGACYKAEDRAIMYRSAQYASKYGVVNRKKDENADGEEEAKDCLLYTSSLCTNNSRFSRLFEKERGEKL